MSEYCGRLELEKGDLKKMSNSELKSWIMRWDTEFPPFEVEHPTTHTCNMYNVHKCNAILIYIPRHYPAEVFPCTPPS